MSILYTIILSSFIACGDKEDDTSTEAVEETETETAE